MTFYVRAPQACASLGAARPAGRRSGVDPNLPIFDMKTMERRW